MIAKFKSFVKSNLRDLTLLVVIFLATLLSFSLGYITAQMENKEPLRFEAPVYEDDL